MKKNNPKFRKIAAKGILKAWKEKRAEKVRQEKIRKQIEKMMKFKKEADEKDRELMENFRRQPAIGGPVNSFWECRGCGYSQGEKFRDFCPKCGGGSFEYIVQQAQEVRS